MSYQITKAYDHIIIQTQVKKPKGIEKVLSKQFSLLVNDQIPNVLSKPGTKPGILIKKVTNFFLNNKLPQKFTTKNNASKFDDLVINKYFNLFFINIKVNSQI